jgi:hypothetical protein
MRERIVLGGFVVLFAVALSSCATTTEKSLRDRGLSPMTQKDLEQRFSRPVNARFEAATGVAGTVAYTPDGSARLDAPNISDTGKWRINNGKACVTWTKIRQGQEGCFTLYKTGPKEYTSFASDGSYNGKTMDID